VLTLSDRLRSEGYSVEALYDGTDAVERAARNHHQPRCLGSIRTAENRGARIPDPRNARFGRIDCARFVGRSSRDQRGCRIWNLAPSSVHSLWFAVSSIGFRCGGNHSPHRGRTPKHYCIRAALSHQPGRPHAGTHPVNFGWPDAASLLVKNQGPQLDAFAWRSAGGSGWINERRMRRKAGTPILR